MQLLFSFLPFLIISTLLTVAIFEADRQNYLYHRRIQKRLAHHAKGR